MEQIGKTFFNLRAKINKYCKKYRNSNVVYLKMIWYCLGQIFKHEKKSKQIDKKKLNICISIGGGIGDILYRSIWVKEFSKLLKKDYKIDLYILNKSKENITKSIFYKNSYIDNVIYSNYLPFLNYDISISVENFVKIEYFNREKISKYSDELLSFMDRYIEFENNHTDFFFNEIENYYTRLILFAINNNKKLVQIPDIDNLLCINAETGSNLCINPENFNILNELKLKDIKYITFVYDVDSSGNLNNNVRLWPLDYFKTLICKIKENCPCIKTVQIGTKRSPIIPEIDIDLRGKTNFDEVKVVLKNSILHIDGECGMVHLKHYLNGTSAVLFGQTSIEVKGYNNNINLRSDGCSHWCEWIVDDWQNHCIRGFKEPPCMTELKPDYVFEQIKPFLDDKLNQPEKVINILSMEDINGYFAEHKVENANIVFFGKEFFDTAKILSQNNAVSVFDYEIDWKLFEEAKKLNIKLDFGDIYNLPKCDNSCDIVVATDLSMFENSELAQKELTRILKNGKMLIIKKKEVNKVC